MKKVLFLLAALAYAGLGSAQSIEADTLPALPPHVYCEITAHHLPTHRNHSYDVHRYKLNNGVLFDFGQKTEVLKYNYLTDAAGNRLLFNSGIEALNYMVCRGWELVQAYTSGEENSLTHYLLRIAPARLTAEQRTELLTPLQGENPKPGKNDKTKRTLRGSFSFPGRFAFPAFLSYIRCVKP